MQDTRVQKEIEIPEGIKVDVKDKCLTAEGKKGTVSREWNNPKINVNVEEGKIVVYSDKPTNREKKAVFTLTAHIKNMLKGVTEGHLYSLKICSGHFPMNVSISNNQISVKNFLGEKIPRVYNIKEGAEVKIDGETVTVESCSKEIAGDTAASIERLTKITNRDRRIFQDGIYITVKDGKEIK